MQRDLDKLGKWDGVNLMRPQHSSVQSPAHGSGQSQYKHRLEVRG